MTNKLDGSQQIMNLIKAQFGTLFNAYFIGSPDVIPDAALPCVIVQKRSASYKAGATMTDDKVEQISIHLLASGKDGFGAPDDDDTVMRQLQNMVEGADATTGQFLDSTIMGIVRKNITLSETIIDNAIEVNYDVTPRVDQPNIMEAAIVVTTVERVFLPNRT